MVLAFLHWCFFDFEHHPLMRRRSSLNHTSVDNSLSILLDSANEAATFAVLREHAHLSEYKRLRQSLNRWDEKIRDEVLRNCEDIAVRFDPFSSGRGVLNKHLTREFSELIERLGPECDRIWLKLRDWKALVEQAIVAYDTELQLVREGISSVADLRQKHQTLVRQYSGKGFFNFCGGS